MAALSANVAKLRASKARRSQSYPPDHPKVREVGQALDYAKLTEHAAKVVNTWPTPTPEQIAEVVGILKLADTGSPPGKPPARKTGGSGAPKRSARKAAVAERLAEMDGGAA